MHTLTSFTHAHIDPCTHSHHPPMHTFTFMFAPTATFDSCSTPRQFANKAKEKVLLGFSLSLPALHGFPLQSFVMFSLAKKINELS